MPSFICKHCKHEFSLKTDLDRHLKRKNACISIEQLQQQQQLIQEENENRNGGVHEISGVFKSCLDILRNDEGHLVGDEALPELSRMIIYKQMEKLIDEGHIDLTQIKNHDAVVEKWGEKYEQNIGLAKFSNLLAYINEKPENILNLKKIMNEFLWKTIGSNHPKLKCVFPEDRKFAIKTSQTFKDLMISLNRVDFNKYDFDVLGEAYERLFVDAIFGAGGNKKSELGQYFTPRKVIQFMINEINPKIKQNGEIESFADFSCGTGGILITAINHYKKLARQSAITEEILKLQFKEKLFGIEIKDKLFNLCAANILLHTGEVLENIVLGDSIRKYWDLKVDKIGANPPFSVKIDYDSLFIQRNDNNGLHTRMNDIMPIRVGGKNSESLFLQMMIHSLNIGGECATVMLDGQKMDNSSAGNLEVREYLMKSCSLDAVIYCPGGTFTSTASKTVILKFTKKKERADVVEPNGRANKRTYKFTKTHATKSVKFYDYRPDIEGNKFLLGEVPIEKIAAKNYSLRLQDYDEEDEREEMEGVQWMKLGDILIDVNSSNIISTGERINGEYDYYSCSRKKLSSQIYHYDGEYLIQGSRGSTICESLFISNGKFSVGTSVFIAESNNSFVYIKYVYHFLKNNSSLYDISGAAIPMISKKSFYNIQIPIPPPPMQQKFIDYCEKIERINQQTKIEIDTLKELKTNPLEMCRMKFPINNRDIMKKLGDVCDMSEKGDVNSSAITNTGEYPFYKASFNNPSGTHNKYSFDGDEYILFVKSGGNAKNPISLTHGIGKSFLVSGKNCANSEVIKIIPIYQFISIKFLFYFLKMNQLYIQSFAKYTTGLGHINMNKFKNLQIPIPSLEEQQSIVEFCENMQKKIEQNEQIIEQLQQIVDSSSEDTNAYLNLILQNQASSVPPNIEEQEVAEEVAEEVVEEVAEEVAEEDTDAIIDMTAVVLKETKKKSKSVVNTQKRKKRNVVVKCG